MAAKVSDLDPIDQFHVHLGRFVHQFSQLEKTMQMYLMLESGVSHNVARAVFSGVKMAEGKSFIKRLREVSGKTEDSEFVERLFAQITVLTTARNDILHHGAAFESVDTGNATVSNAFMAMPGREKEFPVSPEILRNLTADVNSCQSGLAFLLTKAAPIPEGQRAALDHFMETFRRAIESPWRYKPPQQARTRRPPQTDAPTP